MGEPHGTEGDQFRALFEAAPDAMMLAADDRRYLAANAAATRLLGRSHDELLRLRVDDVSPDGADVEGMWRAFLEEGALRGEYELTRPDGSMVEVEFQATANVLPGQHLSIMRDVSDRKRVERERDEATDRLKEAHDHARTVALSLQQAMLPVTDRIKGLEVATRYRPATDAMRVGGDWYDLIDLGRALVGLAVGDVSGHGLAAAGVMGQLRSALAAAMRADPSPARALGTLDAYARSLRTPHIATALTALLDLKRRTLTWSCAGHPPPLLLGDTAEFLTPALSPPLTATAEPEPRPEETAELPAGATLVLFTDGLVEQRGEDIDEGLGRLLDVAKTVADRDCESLADALLDELQPSQDDVALLVLKL